MRDIRGEEYRLAGISIYQKGTLVSVFAKFSNLDDVVNEQGERILSPKPPKMPKEPDAPRTIADAFMDLDLNRFLETLSVQDITDAVVGKKDLQSSRGSHLSLDDKDGVIADLGPEKLAQVLVEMGEAHKQFLEEGHSVFIPFSSEPKASVGPA